MGGVFSIICPTHTGDAGFCGAERARLLARAACCSMYLRQIAQAAGAACGIGGASIAVRGWLVAQLVGDELRSAGGERGGQGGGASSAVQGWLVTVGWASRSAGRSQPGTCVP